MSRREKIEQAREIRLWIRMIVGGVVATRCLFPDLWNTMTDGIKVQYLKLKNKIEDEKAKLEK